MQSSSDSILMRKPGEVILQKLFHEFVILTEKKIDAILSSESLEKPLAKWLQRGEDPIFDQLLTAFGSTAEHCLPSQLRILFDWYERQMSATAVFAEENQRLLRSTNESQQFSIKSGSLTKSNIQSIDNSELELYYTLEKRDLAVEFIFCLVLIEILKQLPLHPGHDDLTGYVETLAFKHFKFREDAQSNPNLANINMIADLYAEVIGVLAYSRFQSVRKRFMNELKELRSKEPSPIITHSIISLLMGMKFFRVKMVPIEEFEASFQFMHECAQYFQDAKDKDIKHALAGLFVEILVPVAATVKNEVNVPCLKNFVDLLYSPCLDLCTKKKHCLAIFPLVTCLLCVSQKTFFLSNWHYFLAMCLSHLKNRDPKMSRVALESLYRLLWVYMIRIKCESNTATQTRLHSIVNSLFPKGSKGVVPRDTPLNIFVKIIQFIAQERLDFAMKEIVFDLLSVGRSIKMVLTPERMSIGLRSFLVVADSLQQKDGEPPMPRTLGVLPSGNTLRVKKTFLNKMLTDEMAKNIGMNNYYPHVKKILSDILRALDTQFGRPLMMTTIQNIKEPDDMLCGERKPKIDLFRTCVAAIPRLIPDGIAKTDLIDLLLRLTINIDEEMNVLAFQALQNLVVDFADWREEVIEGFVNFILHEIADTFQELLSNALRMLLQLLTSWKNTVQQQSSNSLASESNLITEASKAVPRIDLTANVLYSVEALGLVMLCHYRQPDRRLACYILKEVRTISSLSQLPNNKNHNEPVATVIDLTCPLIVQNFLPFIASNERASIIAMSYQIDLQWLAERNTNSWFAERITNNENNVNRSSINQTSNDSRSSIQSANDGGFFIEQVMNSNFDDDLKLNAWNVCLMSLMSEVSKHCPNAVSFAWPTVCQRLNTLVSMIDPNPVNDNRASSILRPTSTLKRSISSSERTFYLELWKMYLMFACSIAPSSITVNQFAPEMCASPDSLSEKQSNIEGSRSPMMNRSITTQSLFKQIIPLLRSDQYEIRNAVVLGLSQVNHYALADFLEELIPYFREAIDRKQENLRRRKRREMLRIQIGRLFKFISERKIFADCPVVLDRDGSLSTVLVEYIDGMRLYFESESDKECTTNDMKESFCYFITNLIKSFPIEARDSKLSKSLRKNLFNLFAQWSNKFGSMFFSQFHHHHNRNSPNNRHHSHQQQQLDFSTITSLELLSIKSMATVLTAGSMFDSKNLLDGNSLYQWLLNLLSTSEKMINDIGSETLVLLLENNTDAGALLEWLIECCYTQPARIADNCFTALATIFSIREYPCDRYIAIIIVTMINIACSRVKIQHLALQLLQILDNRFFFSSNNYKDYSYRLLQEQQKSSLITENNNDRSTFSAKEFEPMLTDLFRYSMTNISERMASLHPQLTMIVFSEITYRFQTARSIVCQNLLEFLIPWLYNMQLVDTTCSSGNDQKNPDYSYSNEQTHNNGWGSIESTQMVLNNLLYITVKFGDDYPNEIEKIWASLCKNRPTNLKIIFRYLFILTGLSPKELLPYAKRISVYLARAQPERVIDELMADLQAVELLSFNAERTEAFPYFRIINRKSSAMHLDEDNYHSNNNNCYDHDNNRSNRSTEDGGEMNGSDHNHETSTSAPVTEIGTLHTKRHSKDYHHKPYDLEANNGANKTNQQNRISNYDSMNESISSDDFNISVELPNDDSLPLSDRYVKPSTPQPRPLPMPEYGGFYAPLKELLNGNSSGGSLQVSNQTSAQPIIGFHRCFLALMFLSDVITQDIYVDWTPNLPLMLHIIFLGMDHSKSIVYEHCKQMLLSLLVTCCKHQDNLTVAKILLKNHIQQKNFGLSIPAIFDFDLSADDENNFNSSNNNLNRKSNHEHKTSEIDLNKIFTKSSENLVSSTSQTTSETISSNFSRTQPKTEDVQSKVLKFDENEEDDYEDDDDDNHLDNILDGKKIGCSSRTNGEANLSSKNRPRQRFSLELYIKTLIDFVSSKRDGPLWNNEDITSKVWSIRSAEQMTTFVEHIVCVFKESLPLAKIENRWADVALWQALQCSSRHYAGRSLQIFRALKIPINRSMLSDILSRLVETVSEQGEDMQGYVTELMLTLESAIDLLDYQPKSILELINQYFHFENAYDEENIPSNIEKEKQSNSLENSTIDTNEENLYPAESLTTLVPSYNGLLNAPNATMRIMKKNPKLPIRSTSYSMSFPTRRFNFLDEQNTSGQQLPRFRNTEDVDSFYKNSLIVEKVSLSRSRSAQSLKNPPFDDDNQTYSIDDESSMLAQFFCIGIILLETEYEYEFLLALRLLDKCFRKLNLDDPECVEKIEKIFVHIKWPNFPGVHQLLLKGLASHLSYEPTINLLHKLTPNLRVPLIDPTKSESAFPFHVMAMLPYLLSNYDEPNNLCIQAAISFAKWCNEVSHRNLENLATVMTLYSKRCFSKENSQWTKCVVKYLHDAYPGSFVMIISFLIEVAEKGPPIFLNHILSILQFMLNYIDLNTSKSINENLIRVVSKYIEGPQWKEALKILKLAVSRSSSLVAPSYSSGTTYASSILSNIISCGFSSFHNEINNITSNSFAENEFLGTNKRELPGRTMDFTFDISQMPIVGAKFIAKRQAICEMAERIKDGRDSATSGVATYSSESNTDRSDLVLAKLFEIRDSLGNSNSINNENSDSECNDSSKNENLNTINNLTSDQMTLKRSIMISQTHIREHLVNLFNRCGKRIVGLPKSPSVIFSQNSDVIDNHKSSLASSTEDISAINNDISGDSKHEDAAHGEFAYFKEFDFLEYELESQEGESLDNFNWGVRRKSLSNLDNDEISSSNIAKSNLNKDTSQHSPHSINFISPLSKLKNDIDESSDDEVESVSPLYEISSHHHQDHQTNYQIQMVYNESNESRPSSLISHGSLHSLVSDQEFSSIVAQSSPTFAETLASNTITNSISTKSNDVEEEKNGENKFMADVSIEIIPSSSVSSKNTDSIRTVINNSSNDFMGSSSSTSSTTILNEIEEQCSFHFEQMINDKSGKILSQANEILVQILRHTLRKMIYLTRETCEILKKSSNSLNARKGKINKGEEIDEEEEEEEEEGEGEQGECLSFNSILRRLINLLDSIENLADFPFVRIDPILFRLIERLPENYQFSIMESFAHWETFNEKSQTLAQTLLNQKSSIGHSTSTQSITKLCKHLYKMHFHLFLLFKCYQKFIDLIRSTIITSSASNSSLDENFKIINHSNEITMVKRKLQEHLFDLIKFETDCSNRTITVPLVRFDTIDVEICSKLKETIERDNYDCFVELIDRLRTKSNVTIMNENLIETLLCIYCETIYDGITKQNDPNESNESYSSNENGGDGDGDFGDMDGEGDVGGRDPNRNSHRYYFVITEPENDVHEMIRQMVNLSFMISQTPKSIIVRAK
ncbi:Heterogeneous nuclear ribonucleoprotein K [Sarcoptes scabiei]|nr:Heterogeneous nuclear ribonucleoprotein K [Sarcoptes scabiei]